MTTFLPRAVVTGIASRGIDVSHHQGTINWPRIKAELDLDWAACKATEGRTFRDSQFTRNWAGIKTAGLVRMAYHFGHPGTDAAAQARFFLSVVQPVTGDVLCLDLETSDGKDQAECNAWAKAFAAAVRKGAPGCTLVAYLGGYSANGTGEGLSRHFDYWWYPRYATSKPVRTWPTSYAPRVKGNTTGWTAPHIWQWAASLATSEGPVDANISPLTAAQLRDGPRPASPQEDVMAKLDDDDRKAIAGIVAAELKAFADEQARRTWAYKNTALEKGDAYQILRDTRDAAKGKR